MERDDEGSALALERLLFFSDAVFAIAITLLVIEIKVPALPHDAGDRDLGMALLQLTPRVIGFVISFFLVGQVWIEHHRMGRLLKSIDTGLLWRNLALLFFVAFMPFATGVLSEFFRSPIAVAFYGVTFAGLGFTKARWWQYAVKRNLVNRSASEVTHISRRVWATPLTAGAVAIAGGLGLPFAVVGFSAIPFVARLMDRPQARSEQPVGRDLADDVA
jgi:uncharacterized membrane protein